MIPGYRAKCALPWAITFRAYGALIRRAPRALIVLFFFAFSFLAIHQSRPPPVITRTKRDSLKLLKRFPF
jgi:hypothetical protein